MADSTEPTADAATTLERGARRIVTGIVTRDQSDKTRRVEIQRVVKHGKYGKFVKRRTVCYMHDEENESALGDTVQLMESRPLSRLKRWRLMAIITKAPSRTLSGLEGAVAGSKVAEATGTEAPKS